MPGDHFQGLGDVLAQLAESVRAATGAALRRRNHHPLARQMRREGLARGRLAGEGLDLGGPRRRLFGGELVFARPRFQFLELQLQLIQQARLALRALAVELAPQLGDLQLESDPISLDTELA